MNLGVGGYEGISCVEIRYIEPVSLIIVDYTLFGHIYLVPGH